ncbi:hypothetical protein CHCC19466_4311 [Bacillus licheniformis]|nr:hypothetical protein B4092_0784 [Bacillus licheniformis]OLG08911.1 hypothetical protein B4124_0773 [Bacillus licheniformis]TWJ51880.1 hypothetical protein CHCC5024_0235 [Bacillus licheniformis]TWJ69210.1 hypothetical protein CHCC5020_0030 [Bacillus licheniformis]TWJ84023.1 hypothetical protein CHCC20495_1094 [Bacillus licheniformis]
MRITPSHFMIKRQAGRNNPIEKDNANIPFIRWNVLKNCTIG